ncbi:SdrD B-like domain-containing protein [Amycolatopsis thailandensis]|uniref:SdrD B-like domain-containing protein n=1 Tax=Amycolatopsis thailandensis TaxID=589330 RepID=UPI003787939E
MSKRPGARSIARTGVVYFAAVAALTGVFATPALADPEPSAPVSTAPATSEAPESSTAPSPSVPPAESSAPAAPKPQAERANIEASVVFDKPSYRTDEDVRFTFKIKNVGTVDSTGIWVSQSFSEPTDLVVPYEPGWGPLVLGREKKNLKPGESFELPVTGKVKDLENASAVVQGIIFDDSSFMVGRFSGTTKITKETGRVTGVVYGDKNGSGTLDDGEKLDGVTLTLHYNNGPTKFTATSDADGRIEFGDVPAAEYRFGGEVIKGWLFPAKLVKIEPGEKNLLLRGSPPLNGALKASLAFAKDTYQPGETAHVTVTLTNSGTIPLTGIVAACNRAGADHAFNGRSGWGELDSDTDGATIAPGQTRTFDVSEKVPDAALNVGYVGVECDFGYGEVDIDNHATAHARAAVPGGVASVIGDVVHNAGPDKPQEGLSGVKVVLVSKGDCPVAGETTTDEKGHFEFRKVAPGPDYSLYFLPPQGWRIKYDNPTSILVVGPEDNAGRTFVEAEKGEAPLPAVPAQPSTCGKPGTTTPVPGAPGGEQGSGGGQGGSGLASTGADVLWLGALALAALGLGGALMFGARRRRRPVE